MSLSSNASQIGWRKYKYYFKKPKSIIIRDIFETLLLVGTIAIAATSPCFLTNLFKGYRRWKKYPRRKVADTFYRLKKKGMIEIKRDGRQIYIHLTEKGREQAGIFQIDNLEIKKPVKWDKKWRMVIFDIKELKRIRREAFRGKLKELGFCQLQKSVWIHPFDCRAEIELLREFFGLSIKELRLIVAESIEVDVEEKKLFKLE